MIMVLALMGFCITSTCIVVNYIAFNDRERLTTLVCIFCFLCTYLVFDIIAFDPKMRLEEHLINEPIKTNISTDYYYLLSSI
jgi:hypothetical protein